MESETVSIAIQSEVDVITKPSDALCIDLSRKGALLQCQQAMPLGTLIAVTFNAGRDNQNTVKGQVCRCITVDKQKFNVALQLI
ncbi:pilus assembly protein PilZ [Shewanella sairae]|uniref:Pilus assembly protein PilZ n=1 Tax=Shewanella sairae TaxID=190310 RepID=A0ABQ4PJ86_9GAMM|nr:PilZ domain-containing protein [Shewanella sairae]MCL1130350.1 PilZ domain-containing protein [Shewanella sairae]GIU47743.1 pilus assembly protein PilZ [Shewanella sairae]